MSTAFMLTMLITLFITSKTKGFKAKLSTVFSSPTVNYCQLIIYTIVQHAQFSCLKPNFTNSPKNIFLKLQNIKVNI